MSLNDPQWGRSGGNNDDDRSKDNDNRQRPNNDKDIDELWKDFNKVLGGIFNPQEKRPENPFERGPQNEDEPEDVREKNPFGGNGGNDNGGSIRNPFSGFKRPAPPKANGRFFGIAAIAAVLVWGASGFYIVPEGQAGVVTTFGRYTETKMPGFRWHLPIPIQKAELVDISTVRTAEIGVYGRPNREREALMLTDDENIVDVRFTVQYRIRAGQDSAMQYLFRSKDPDASVQQAAESAMREVVGRKYMDSVLFESKQEIAEQVKRIMQDMLNRYRTGIEVMNVAIQNAQPPQQVQASFNDAVKAGQDRERQINEGQAYANDVIPKARGTAVRLVQEAEAYKAKVEQTAQGDADRFSMILKQYEDAPVVTRDRMYIDALEQIYSNVTKVYVDAKSGSNLLYLPFDKLLEKSAQGAPVSLPAQPAPAVQDTAGQSSPAQASNSREPSRLRTR